MYEVLLGHLKRAHKPPLDLYKPSFIPIVITSLFFVFPANAENLQDGIDAYVSGNYATAYRVLSPAATSGNPRVINLVGLMLYRGQGTAADAPAAHELFHSAAELGVADARRNLGIMHSIGAAGVPIDYEEARMWFTVGAATGNQDVASPAAVAIKIPASVETVINFDLKFDGEGKHTYLTFCAGCHGFGGMRFFPFAPSFAMAERLTKSDGELMTSILNGKGLMPSWENKLAMSRLRSTLGYLRELALRTGYGTADDVEDDLPATYFLFQPPGMIELYSLGLISDPLDDP